tara:strand:- start:758 stop:1066 length:309 start_codon:yes stop_codon:yes gene_type:complete
LGRLDLLANQPVNTSGLYNKPPRRVRIPTRPAHVGVMLENIRTSTATISTLEARTLSQDLTITDLSNNVNLSNQKIATLETTIETLKTALNELLSDAGKPTI